MPPARPMWRAAGSWLTRVLRSGFAGSSEPVDPVAGHIPGARNLPAPRTLERDGTLLEAEALRSRLSAIGAVPDRPVGVYCGSGVVASQSVLAMASVGIEAALYAGSWSDWITDPARPVATGE